MRILHLYHDLMNLYGDYANVLALSRILETNGIKHTVEKKSLCDKIDFNRYDFVYIGSGSEENQKIALEHLKKYRQEFSEYINSGKYCLLTGNAFEMIGKEIDSFLGCFEGLGICEFKTYEQNKVRNVSDAIVRFNEIDKSLVGFINKCSKVEGVISPLFSVEMGLGNNDGEKTEGVRFNNLFGTHLTGPILVKNPHFLKFLASSLTESALSDSAFSHEKAGFEITLQKLSERI